MRRIGVAAVVALAAGWAGPAWASGDNFCRPSWTLATRALSDCDSRAVLGPANDTRVNLLLLMRERRGAAVEPTGPAGTRPGPFFNWTALRDWHVPQAPEREEYAGGEGSRCRSNDTARDSFVAAVRAARGIADADRATLIAARQALDPECETARPLGIATVGAAAQPFAAYVAAAAAFYAGQWDAAARGFDGLTGASDPWLAETARYMAGRVPLNAAQTDAFDEWGELDFAKVDRAALARSQAGFEAYLARFPRGRYAQSARGLLRRLWWLGGDQTRLAAAYAALMAQDPATRGIDDFALAQEIDNKLRAPKSGSVTDPYLLAVYDLAAMRAGPVETENDLRLPALTEATLTAQRASFARAPALYAYLQAAFAFYVAKRPADVLRLVPAETGRPGPVDLARQLLRGQALDATGDAGAGAFWQALLARTPGTLPLSTVELGYALHEERAGHVAALLGPGSPLVTPAYRAQLLGTVADASILRRAATDARAPARERDVALFVLLYKELSRGLYADFGRDLALVRPASPTEHNSWETMYERAQIPTGLFTRTTHLGDLGCPPLKATAATLAANPRDPRGRLCVADFFQANGFDGGEYDAQPGADELGGTRSLFPGRPYERAAVYRALLADPATSADDRAYALYRAIRCYQPVGNNSCGGADVPPATRRAWFRQLKTEFPRSRWAQSNLYW